MKRVALVMAIVAISVLYSVHMLTQTLAETRDLVSVWSVRVGDGVERLAFNHNLAVASDDHCGYVFDTNGRLLNRVCGYKTMHDVSYYNKMFGFINEDGNVYITDMNGKLIKKIFVGRHYGSGITLAPNGFVACKYSCAFFDYNGNRLWNVDVGEVKRGPAYYGGYWYAADEEWRGLLVIRDGKIVNMIRYGEKAMSAATCGKYLAVVTKRSLHLYDLGNPANPKEIWSRDQLYKAYDVAFSPDCKYIVVADEDHRAIRIYDIAGNLVLTKSLGMKVKAVAWYDDMIAAGLKDGIVYVFKVGTLMNRVVTKATTTTVQTAVQPRPIVTVTTTKPLPTSSPTYSNTEVTKKTEKYMLPPTVANLKRTLHSIETIYKLERTSTVTNELKSALLRSLNNMTDLFTFSALLDQAIKYTEALMSDTTKVYKSLATIPADVNQMKASDISKLKDTMYRIYKAKVYAMLLNDTIRHMDNVVANMQTEKCERVTEALGLLKSLTSAKSLAELGTTMLKIRNEYGSIDAALKCLIGGVKYEVKTMWNEAKREFYTVEINALNQLQQYEQLLNLVIQPR